MATAPTLKRKFIDTEGNEIEKGKRNRDLQLDDSEKGKAVEYAIRLTVNIGNHLKVPASIYEEVMASTALFNVTYHTHQFARGLLTNTAAGRIAKIKANTQTHHIAGKDYVISAADMEHLWNATVKEMGWAADLKGVIPRTHTVVCLMQLFHNRMRELQIGPDSWIATKSEGTISQYNIASFGIPAQYRHFMSGVSWDIGLRSTLSKFTSGLSQLAILSSQDKEHALFAQRNKVAVERAYGYIPHINMISDFVMKHDGVSNRMILEKMAHITALHGDKHKRRCSPPFNVIYAHCVGADTLDEKLNIVNTTDIGFSSKKAALLYNQHMHTLKLPLGIDKNAAKQLVFHAYFGTHGEDFGVLSEITSCAGWLRRENIKRQLFMTMKSGKETQSVQGIAIRAYAKSISASNNKLMAQSGSVFGTLETFAGYRQKNFSEEFIRFARGHETETADIIPGNASSIVRYLDSIVEMLAKKIEEQVKGKSLESGTTKWHDIGSATYETGKNGHELVVVPIESGKCFWAN